MKPKLKNIFVPFELAKLAYEKGFREWCACVSWNEFGHKDYLANSFTFGHRYDFQYDPVNIEEKNENEETSTPTHLQLILWLKNTHNIDVTMGHNGLWSVLDSQGTLIYQNDECFFEINQALEIGLKLVEPCQP